MGGGGALAHHLVKPDSRVLCCKNLGNRVTKVFGFAGSGVIFDNVYFSAFIDPEQVAGVNHEGGVNAGGQVEKMQRLIQAGLGRNMDIGALGEQGIVQA